MVNGIKAQTFQFYTIFNVHSKNIEGRFQGKKTPGRPRTMLLDALMQEDEESVIDYAKLKEKAHDRETWRQ